jgi:hypothetical protein
MSDPRHQDDKHVIMNFIDYPVIGNSNAVDISAFQLLATGRARVTAQFIDFPRDSAAQFALDTQKEFSSF